MKSKTLKASVMAGLVGLSCMTAANAQLEGIEEPKSGWNSFYFAGYKMKGADVGFDTDGDLDIIPIGKNRERMATNYFIPLKYEIRDVAADGKVTVKKIDVDSLTSDSKPTAKPDKILVKGKTEGDATFELYYEVSRGNVLVGGRILEKGSLANPKFAITIVMPAVYAKAPDDEKAFKKRIEDDFLQVKLMDGKKAKVEADEEFDITSAEFAGAGLSEVEFMIDELGAREFTLTASPGSKITAANKQGKPFYDGLNFTWEAD
ncbi:MAG: hypothetical protein EOP84_12550, partial [Verrucomicrobiaceae bacterium]